MIDVNFDDIIPKYEGKVDASNFINSIIENPRNTVYSLSIDNSMNINNNQFGLPIKSYVYSDDDYSEQKCNYNDVIGLAIFNFLFDEINDDELKSIIEKEVEDNFENYYSFAVTKLIGADLKSSYDMIMISYGWFNIDNLDPINNNDFLKTLFNNNMMENFRSELITDESILYIHIDVAAKLARDNISNQIKITYFDKFIEERLIDNGKFTQLYNMFGFRYYKNLSLVNRVFEYILDLGLEQIENLFLPSFLVEIFLENAQHPQAEVTIKKVYKSKRIKEFLDRYLDFNCPVEINDSSNDLELLKYYIDHE